MPSKSFPQTNTCMDWEVSRLSPLESHRVLTRSIGLIVFDTLLEHTGPLKSQYISDNKQFRWCPEGDLNPHDQLRSADFKSAASANFAIRAWRLPSTS